MTTTLGNGDTRDASGVWSSRAADAETWLLDIQEAHRRLLAEYASISHALARRAARGEPSGAEPFVRGHIHDRLTELRDVYLRFASGLPYENQGRSWLTARAAELAELAHAFPTTSPWNAMKRVLTSIPSIVGLVASLIAGPQLVEWLTKNTDAWLWPGIGVASGAVIPLLIWVSGIGAGFHEKRDLFLGGADDGRWFRRRAWYGAKRRAVRNGPNVYELENRLFSLVTAAPSAERQVDVQLASGLLAVVYLTFLIPWMIVETSFVESRMAFVISAPGAVLPVLVMAYFARSGKRKWATRPFAPESVSELDETARRAQALVA